MFRHLQKHTKTRWPLYLQYCETFLNAYINSYPAHLRKELAIFIETTLDDGLHKVLYEKIIKTTNINSKKFNVKEFKKTIKKCLIKFKDLS